MVGLLVTILFTYKTLEMVSAWWVLALDNLYLTILVARYQEPIILLPSPSHQQLLKQQQQQQQSLKTQKNYGNIVRSLLELPLFISIWSSYTPSSDGMVELDCQIMLMLFIPFLCFPFCPKFYLWHFRSLFVTPNCHEPFKLSSRLELICNYYQLYLRFSQLTFWEK